MCKLSNARLSGAQVFLGGKISVRFSVAGPRSTWHTSSDFSDMKPVFQPLPLLKQYFGFTSFRPLQEQIIRDALAGRDVLALLPTGGGKSLCFQLPALARPGLTVVVSPLISLMKDQVDALQASGVPATFLNSSLIFFSSRRRHTRCSRDWSSDVCSSD